LLWAPHNIAGKKAYNTGNVLVHFFPLCRWEKI
jgi:hypothetical protein